ncbi:MAG: hypothetical protein AAF404_00130 [Pseudomonadota bacterium]
MKLLSFNFLRPAALFCVMVTVFAISTHQRVYSRLWHEPLEVVVYPINGDSTLGTHNYIQSLTDQHFAEIDEWMSREAVRYDLPQTQPFQTRLGPPVKSNPPLLPDQSNVFAVVWWGLKLRWWVWRNTPDDKSNLRRVRVFASFRSDDASLPHSVGLQKGLIGVVHAFSLDSQTSQNNIVIAHEILHTVGASDKYSFSGQPLYPLGYANPNRAPLYPQRYAEIMAGKIPTSSHSSYMAESLKSTRINRLTAMEIAWIE